jgi:catechol 2,3-dioxygenase-like lactoylglutathione lyase family enzyme
MLRPIRIAETALYVNDLERALEFYTRLLKLRVILREERFCALGVTEEQVLLLFRRGASVEPTVLTFGTVPAHDGSGRLHVCFGIDSGTTNEWEDCLRRSGVEIESRVEWPHGPTSLYFRDPDGNAVELATPGLWKAGTKFS